MIKNANIGKVFWINLLLILTGCSSGKKLSPIAVQQATQATNPSIPSGAMLSFGGGSAVNFNEVVVGESTSQTVSITNNGTAAAVLNSFPAVSAPFSISQNNCQGNLVPGSHCTFDLSFSPSEVRGYSEQLTVPYLDQNSGAVQSTSPLNISGSGRNASNAFTSNLFYNNPPSGDFGEVTVGQSGIPQIFRITNSGTGPATIRIFSSLGSPFFMNDAENTCDGVLTPGGGSCTFVVRFSPMVAGASFSQVLAFRYSDDTTLIERYLPLIWLAGESNGYIPPPSPTPSPSPSTDLFFDDFERPDSSSVGSNYTSYSDPNGFKILGGALVLDWAALMVNSLVEKDINLEADVVSSTNPTGVFGLISRIQGTNPYSGKKYQAQLAWGLPGHENKMVPRMRYWNPAINPTTNAVTGWVNLSHGAGFPISSGRMRFSAIGTQLSIYWNGNAVLSISDSKITTAGSVSVSGHGSTSHTNGGKMLNFRVYKN